MIPWDVPVTPDADEAHRLLAQELARPEYSRDTSLWDSIMQWLRDLWNSFDGRGPTQQTLAIVIVVLALAIAVFAIWRAGPLSRRRKVGQDVPVLEGDDTRSASQILAAARQASALQEWNTALLEYFRALARGLEERVIIDERAGRTAHELVAEATAAFPDAGAQLAWAARTFEEVYYGSHQATGDQCQRMAQLEELLRATKPLRAGAGVGV